MLELDHLIVFLPGPDRCAGLDRVAAADLVLDRGIRHVGQGTRNRRIVFPDSYVELLWVDSPAEARASGLRFEERCDGRARPFGVVLRGRAPEHPGFVTYAVPAGPTLRVLDDPAAPFLAVHEAADLDPLRPARRMDPEVVNAATGIAHAEIVGAGAGAALGIAGALRGVSFADGEPALRLALRGRSGSLVLRPG
ncbi:VOC family protein [Pseudonocardia humida]|uniref:VOC family protein n=1 Tax=Pseudonocardia humida TaxID=2800819 RepID=A0ABT1A2W3_9PSEU|nr:VOC family protein [Pseudonocardia humida]MCO1657337.1 VOC family protein [Pseudonocardia humida]